jgi:hypothetical protein
MGWGPEKPVLFMASADPLGTNPFHDCQLFGISPLGLNLRQITRFGEGVEPIENCSYVHARPGCGIANVLQGWAPPHSLVFSSDCDPFGANPDGGQLFAIDDDGSHLRQVTQIAGARRDADGTLEVELVGPVAVGR